MSRYGPPRGTWSEGGRWGGRTPGEPWWRAFASGDNPLTWSLPIGRVFGISIRVSLIYVLWMIIKLISHKDIGWTYELWSLGSLFTLVLLHEFGHCFACRAVGGEADEILMWMLGGLASCRPPHNWRASLITTLGGPGVNVALFPVFAGAMMALGVPLHALVFNPWGGGIGSAWFSAFTAMSGKVPDWLAYGLFTLHVSNASLLLFNMLLAFIPFDGGRIVQELLWRKYGYTRSMYIATGVGLGGAAIVGLFALVVGSVSLVLIALFGGYSCYHLRMHLKFTRGMGDDSPKGWGDDDGESWKLGRKTIRGSSLAGPSPRDQKRQEKARKAADAQRAQAQNDGVELDRILAKIKDKGMASLTRGEEAFLRRSTQKSRGGGGESR